MQKQNFNENIPKIISVYSDEGIFDKVVKNNEFYKICEIIGFDNRKENISVTKKYNNFIKEKIQSNENEDFWCVFIHQDFGIEEDINPILKKLDKNFIYGAVGIKTAKGIFLKREYKGGPLKLKFTKRILMGQILQGKNDTISFLHGKFLTSPKTVEAIDCCCIILHSTLIKKYNLEFDENLKFHMYAEELCYRAKKDHKIKSKVVQIKSFHLSEGSLNEEFYNSVKYLKNKFKIKKIPSTCNT